MKLLFKHFNLIMLAVCVLAFLAAEHIDAPWLFGLGMAALGLTGSVEGLQAIWRGEHVELIDGDSSDEISFHGLSARLLGFSLMVPGLIAVSLGLLMLLQWQIGEFLRDHWPPLVGVGGLWLAARGGVLMLGSDQDREDSLSRRLLTGLPLIGTVLCAVGLGVAVFAFGGINPLRLLP